MSANNRHDILIWDAESFIPIGDTTTVLWRGFSTGSLPNCVSMPELIEENADVFRARYLAWVFELGETCIKGRRLVDHLQLRPGFSYWWMTLLVEKCNFAKSPQINDAIRFLAFVDWAVGKNVRFVNLATANRRLAECFALWSAQLGIEFRWKQLQADESPTSLRSGLYQALPRCMRAIAWLVNFVVERWHLSGVGLDAWRRSKASVTFVSYLYNLEPCSQSAGLYESRYWSRLPDILREEACKTNWLHLYVKDKLLPTSKIAAKTIEGFNKHANGSQSHVTLDSFLSVKVVLCALLDWLKLLWLDVLLYRKLKSDRVDSQILWPLLRDDWSESMRGATAMWNVLSFNLFESSLAQLPKQNGAYLQENQGWEFGMISAWRAAGHKKLVGVPHSTVRYWDLRYFFDTRSYQRNDCNNMPKPDVVACNGPAMREQFLGGGYPEGGLVDVEALRYLYLANFLKPEPTAGKGKTEEREHIRILVLGDYVLKNTETQMNILSRAMPMLPRGVEIIVKPHPNCPVDPARYQAIPMQVTFELVSELLLNCDVAFTSTTTSASVDAYSAGVSVISVLDPATLNLSPLRGCAGITFISTPEELVNAVAAVENGASVKFVRQEFFTTDHGLSRWRKLLLV